MMNENNSDSSNKENLDEKKINEKTFARIDSLRKQTTITKYNNDDHIKASANKISEAENETKKAAVNLEEAEQKHQHKAIDYWNIFFAVFISIETIIIFTIIVFNYLDSVPLNIPDYIITTIIVSMFVETLGVVCIIIRYIFSIHK